MNTVRTRRSLATVAVYLGLAAALPASAENVFSGVGAAAATAKTSFVSAVGGANNGGNPPAQTSGFRAINWDGVKLDGTDFNGNTTVISAGKTIGIPPNRFQGRGVLFDEIYAVSGDGFASVNAAVAGAFPAFSPANTFAPFNENTIDVAFVLPSDPTSKAARAAVRGFGAIFEDVEKANVSSIEYFNGDVSLGRYFVPAGAHAETEFLGVLFDAAVVTRVRLTLGDATIFNLFGGAVSAGPAGADLVATDDFLYSEPVPAPVASFLPSSAHATGLAGSVYATDLTILNRGTSETAVTVKFLGHDADGRNGAEFTENVAAGATLRVADVLNSKFGVGNGYGALRISWPSSAVSALGETFAVSPAGGTFGQAVPALAGSDLVYAGSRKFIAGLREDASYRTNLFVVNTTEENADLRLFLVAEDGTLIVTQDLSFAPLEMRQISGLIGALAGTGYGSIANATLVIAPQTAGSAFGAYASVIDNRTNDPRTLLAK
jgi:hypothetical protein